MKLRALPVLLLAAAALALQGPLPIPPCVGKECTDEVTGQDRAGQPAWCQNYDTTAWKANCECMRDCDEPDNHPTGCATYCRTKKCRCDHGCGSVGAAQRTAKKRRAE